MISRRHALSGGAAALAALALPSSAAGPTLADAARRAGLIYGASVGDEAFADRDYLDLYARETAIVTTDVALKFDWVRPTRERFEFARADKIVGAAQSAGKLVRGHTLIWNDNPPDWLKRLSGSEVERVFDEHIEVVASRYAGKLHSIDVVNEPFWPMDRQPGGWRNGPWFAAMGPSYVERAFRRVYAIDKTSKLTLNEAQCENDHSWGQDIRPCLARLVEDLVDKGVPLHAIGFQSHLQPQWPVNYIAFADYADGFGRKGLELYLTEFDVNDRSFGDDALAAKRAVAENGSGFLDAVLKNPAVKMVVNWQLSDRYSWYRDLWTRGGRLGTRLSSTLPYDDRLNPNPLRAAMIASFDARGRKT